MSVAVRTITACRACGAGALASVLDLGNLAVSDFLEPGQTPDRAPLVLVRCGGCGLVQLRHSVDRDRLYRTYHYRSSVNETMVAALRDVVDDATRRVDLRIGDCVLDIGCNDGALLRHYPDTVSRYGFDPSDVATAAWEHRSFSYTLVRDYFPTRRQHTARLCKVITAVACFYDVDDPGGFLEEARRWLHPEGVLVLQFQDLAAMLDAGAVDNVCHEHLTYWDEESVRALAERHGLVVFDWSRHDVNGGSIRLVLRHGVTSPSRYYALPRVPADDLRDFARRVHRDRAEVVGLLRDLRRCGRTVYGIAASTKFNTLSQFYGIGPDLITAIGERSPHKVGKTTVTGIPICSEEEMRAAKPDYLVVCAWGFADAFAEREKALLEQGTKLIVPLPALRIVGAGERALAEVG